MFDWATAAFIKRRSRMAAVIAAVPIAAQPTRRRNCRRVMTEMFFWCINYFWIVKSGELMIRWTTARTRSRIWAWLVGEAKFAVLVT